MVRRCSESRRLSASRGGGAAVGAEASPQSGQFGRALRPCSGRRMAMRPYFCYRRASAWAAVTSALDP
jgi:hypothetical protein